MKFTRRKPAKRKCAAGRGHEGRANLHDGLSPFTERVQFPNPSRDPKGDVIAGSPGWRPRTRVASTLMSRPGIGIDRRPAAIFVLPSTSLPALL